ncbi:16S rRNA m(2)G 1207 methyltransferase [Virgibacillus subterraneus]|uniref:16S rRNA m(2)G 1207 methyltransferase n=1 Tax=Virgibacillus subterraneus TaxID=621109 RepID=A0A1H9KST0_9BACI|nr:class I SAM-dependent methyltransferase [Virgibacillus subterraneus]SER02099.1 16S rRNA m(2)G 1207 methyltransferase [Virgibacillus subterraneus]
MSEHYFSQNPQSKSSPKKWIYQLRGKVYTFESDYGVFSKNEVDYGSRLLIEQFRPPSITGEFLDLGCGYGPIGITLADCYQDRNIILTDINERAINLAQQNADHNNVVNVEFVQSDRLSNLTNRSFAAILTNPPIRAGKKVVHQMFEDSKNALLQHGQLWVVIQKKQGAPSAKEKLSDLFGNVEVVVRSKGYFILRATND